MTETDMINAIRNRYGEGYIVMGGVRSSTGYPSTTITTADCLVLGTWPSRGIQLDGFEMKCSRGDWTRELKNPEKAENIARFCDRWWIVTPRGLLTKDEIPVGWGLMECHGGKARTKKVAPVKTPDPLTLPFIASLCRSAEIEGSKKAQSHRDEETTNIAYQRGLDDGRKDADHVNILKKRLEEALFGFTNLRKSVEMFEKVSGITIRDYNGKRLGDAVQLVLGLGNVSKDPVYPLRSLRSMLSEYLTSVDMDIERLSGIMECSESPDNEGNP